MVASGAPLVELSLPPQGPCIDSHPNAHFHSEVGFAVAVHSKSHNSSKSPAFFSELFALSFMDVHVCVMLGEGRGV